MPFPCGPGLLRNLMCLTFLCPLLAFGADGVGEDGETGSDSWLDAIQVDRVSVMYGNANANIDVYRLGWQKWFGCRWLDSRVGSVTGFWELSGMYWDEESVKGGGFSPVFIYQFDKLSDAYTPYLEGGIGVGYVSQRKIGRRDLSSHWQFEDRLGFGVRFGNEGEYDLGFRYMHYSNAGLDGDNDGIDIMSVVYTQGF